MLVLCAIGMITGCNSKKREMAEKKAVRMTSSPIMTDARQKVQTMKEENKTVQVAKEKSKTMQEGKEKLKQQNNQETEQNAGKKKLIVIDAGHQQNGNYEKEPIGPGASSTKPKVASGTEGCSTKIPEYELNLNVSMKLQEELQNRGYEVIMVRTKNEVNLSNAERAAVANDAGADAFLRIHANADDNSSAQGALTISPTKESPYCSQIYEDSYRLSSLVLDELCKSTGAKKRSVWETDTMSGINWCEVPVTIVEMGFMSNPKEDRLLNNSDYQRKIVQGIANGVDAYMKAK